MDYEANLRARKPVLEPWTQIQNYYHTPYETFKTYLTVPSSYDSSSEEGRDQVRLYIQKYVNINNVHVMPQVFMILLSGGPGLEGEDQEPAVARLLSHFSSLALVCYTIDPRGVGKSSKFIPDGHKLDGLCRDDLNLIIKEGPFAITDLSIHTAALDAGMLAIALQATPEWQPSSRLIIQGSSYGAAVAHQSIKVLPFLYDGGFIEMVPQVRGLSAPGLIGLAEHCGLDPFCRSFFPSQGSIWEEVRAAIKDIIGAKANECVRTFVNYFDRDYFRRTIPMDRRVLLSLVFRETMGAKRLSTGFRPAQLLLPFLRITSECRLSREDYIRQVLKPLEPYIRRGQPINVVWTMGSSSQMNHLANGILILDLEYYAGIPKADPLSPAYEDMSISLASKLHYDKNYRLLAPHLTGYRFTDTRPLRTPRTRLLISNSRLDFNTGYRQAWELYSSLEAPEKYWLLLEHRHHESTWTTCHAQVIGYLMGLDEGAMGPRREADLDECLRRANEEERLDWSFSGVPSLAALWTFLDKRGAPSAWISPETIPSVAIGSKATRSIPPTASEVPLGPTATIEPPGIIMGNRSVLWGTAALILTILIVSSLLLVTAYWRSKRQREDVSKTQSAVIDA